MQQTKPLFAIRNYPSIRWAAIIAETVNSFVSLTDSMVAGNLLGSQALTAIGLVAPFLTFSTLGSSIVNSGKTIMIIGWRNQSRIRLISLPNDRFGSE